MRTIRQLFKLLEEQLFIDILEVSNSDFLDECKEYVQNEGSLSEEEFTKVKNFITLRREFGFRLKNAGDNLDLSGLYMGFDLPDIILADIRSRPMHTLSLSNNQIDDQGLLAVIALLRLNKSIKVIDLSNNNLTQKSGEKLISFLSEENNHRSVEKINLQGNKIPPDQEEKINILLQKVKIVKNDGIDLTLDTFVFPPQTNQNLASYLKKIEVNGEVELELDEFDITIEEAYEIKSFLESYKNIQLISMVKNPLCDNEALEWNSEKVEIILSGLMNSQSIEDIWINRILLDATFLNEFLKNLQKNKNNSKDNLYILSFPGCGIDDAGLNVFAELIKENRIESLNLLDNPISDVSDILGALENNLQIIQFSISSTKTLQKDDENSRLCAGFFETYVNRNINYQSLKNSLLALKKTVLTPGSNIKNILMEKHRLAQFFKTLSGTYPLPRVAKEEFKALFLDLGIEFFSLYKKTNKRKNHPLVEGESRAIKKVKHEEAKSEIFTVLSENRDIHFFRKKLEELFCIDIFDNKLDMNVFIEHQELMINALDLTKEEFELIKEYFDLKNMLESQFDLGEDTFAKLAAIIDLKDTVNLNYKKENFLSQLIALKDFANLEIEICVDSLELDMMEPDASVFACFAIICNEAKAFETFDFSDDNMTSADLAILLRVLKNFPVRSLILKDNKFDNAIIADILAFIKENPSIETINLNGNQFDDDGAKQFIEFFKLKAENTSLKTFSLERNKISQDYLDNIKKCLKSYLPKLYLPTQDTFFESIIDDVDSIFGLGKGSTISDFDGVLDMKFF